MKLKVIDDNTTIYASPNGSHYHLDRHCRMLEGGDFERLFYSEIRKEEIKTRHLVPCFCTTKEYEN